MKKVLLLILALFSMIALVSCGGETPRIQLLSVSALRNYDEYILIFEPDVPVERYQIEYSYQNQTVKETVATDYFKIKLKTDEQRAYTFIITAVGDQKDTLNSIPYTFKLNAEKFRVPDIDIWLTQRDDLQIVNFNEDVNIHYSLHFICNDVDVFNIENVHTGHDFSINEIENILKKKIPGDMTGEIKVELKIYSSEDTDYYRNNESEVIFLYNLNL